jgi:hypothetical protein
MQSKLWKFSVIATLICLFVFGYFKSKITGVKPVEGALKVMGIGARRLQPRFCCRNYSRLRTYKSYLLVFELDKAHESLDLLNHHPLNALAHLIFNVYLLINDSTGAFIPAKPYKRSLPTICVSGTKPQKRLSWLRCRLSPIIQ